MAIYNVEDLPELTDLNAINRSVPAMPSGMEKEEESEKHLQDILDAQSSHNTTEQKTLYIPTPEVFDTDTSLYRKGYKVPRQFIHVQPFSMDTEKPDYDLDEEDVKFIDENLRGQKKFEIDNSTFEDMIDRLEKNSGHSVVSGKEAKYLLKEDDDLILAVYDYWVDKRLRLKQPLLPVVKSDKRDITNSGVQVAIPMMIPVSSSVSGLATPIPGTPGIPGQVVLSGGSGSVVGSGTPNVTNTNPYIAFRRRTEKMQTRKNRKNDESSYEKMLKLRRDLSRAIILLEMVKRREKTKKENLTLTAEIFEKRFQAGDYDGKVISEIQAQKSIRVLQPTQNQYFANRFTENWLANHSSQLQQPRNMGHYISNNSGRHDKKSNKKRKKSGGGINALHHHSLYGGYQGASFGSDDDAFSATGMSTNSDYEDDPLDAPFAFRRKANCQYLAPLTTSFGGDQEQAQVDQDQESTSEPRFRYAFASLSTPKPRFIGRVRRRVGRGGRCLIDRMTTPLMIEDLEDSCARENLPHYRPVTPPHVKEDEDLWDNLSGQFADVLALPSLPSSATPFISKIPILPTALSSVHSERQRSISGVGLRTVPVDSVSAQNAVTALVTNDIMDIFGK
jgi:enhancer of polycomb-like protein